MLRSEIMDDIDTLLDTGDFTLGKHLQEFEKAFASYCGVKHAIGVGNGTDALQLALGANGIWDGTRVITTPFTFVATVGAIVACGARPVFVDNGDDLCISPEKIERALHIHDAQAILPVHWAGNVASMFEINRIAKSHDLAVIEDVCQAIGASETYSVMGNVVHHCAGSFGNAAAFSLHPLKNLNCWGDGGMVTTNDDNIAREIRLQRNHGLVNRDEVIEFGVNSRLDTLQAIVCLKQMPDLDKMLDKRIAIASRYNEAFWGLKGVKVPLPRRGVRHTYHLYQLKVDKRDEFLSYLTGEKAIDAKVHYPIPVHLQGAARHLGYKPGDFPQCESDCKHVVSLPVHPYLTEEEIQYVIEAVRGFYEPKPL